ncbi:hypothetical protein BCR39DRAFT_498322 [Naematelia encephala]|uniref:Cora-like Mg2+ transporter protein-domain-containing protein n=1 Tax=Naematelia encephala TaxID=71784 RepID=A0A1Y2AV57_9TREE|nr:hypothetical protein BCR39DRAFT_498322 [Naematelia encephala]
MILNRTQPVPGYSPILTSHPPPSDQPQFAELLTPEKLRRKRRQHPHYQTIPTSVPLQAGPSHHGYYTHEGDLYRGAASDPTYVVSNDDAITLSGGSTTSSSSSWSWGSGNLERGRRATMAVIERFGEVIGVRRGSDSDGSDDARSQGTARRRISRRLTRTLSRAASDGASPEKPKREHLPRRREFTLLLPKEAGKDRVITTPTLPVVLEYIRDLRTASGLLDVDVPIQRGGSAPGRSRDISRPRIRPGASFANPPLPRQQSRLHALRQSTVRPKSVSDLMGMVNPHAVDTRSEALPIESKGKEKEGCWWLDVACPGWEDLRDIGELLGLHPLTLEDVLQQDPREKLDTFDKLGYYFLVVRSLDEGYFKYTPGSPLVVPSPEPERKEGRRRGWGMGRAVGKLAGKSGEKVEIVEDNPGKEGLEGVGVGAVNVYIVVFADGIVSFHFEDISKHTRRVLDRILSLEEDQSADWVAHGLLDSIVDAFFPLIRYVDGEVDDIDSLTIDPTTDPKKPVVSSPSPNLSETSISEESIEMSEKFGEKALQEWRQPPIPPRPPIWKRYTIPRIKIHIPRPLVYFRLFFLPTTSARRSKHEKMAEQIFDRSTMLKRITDMRRLVTGLTRLLGAKHQVIGRLRKRARDGGSSAVDAYMGDVEDHILLLQTSLFHYEYMLAHCQPAYLSHLSVSFTLAKGGTDKAILALSTVTISVLPMQFICGLFSMNIRIPHNGDRYTHLEPDGSLSPFNYFAGIVIGIFLVACGMVTLIRYWRWLARVKWAGLRGETVPRPWDGYWGWS